MWILGVGVPAALRGLWKPPARGEEERVTGEPVAELRPRDHALFSGVVTPEQLPSAGRVVFRAMALRYGDYRDRNAVDAFADDTARALSPSPSPADGA